MKQLFYITACLPIMLLIVVVFYKEEKKIIMTDGKNKTIKEEILILKGLVFRDKVLEMVMFILLLNLTPSFEQITTFYMTEYLHFSAKTLSNFSTIANLCYIIGLITYYYYFIKMDPRKFFLTTNLMLWLVNCFFMLVVT